MQVPRWKQMTFQSNFGKQLTFAQLCYFRKFHSEYSLNINIPYISCFCEVFENCCLLVKLLNKQRLKLLQSFPTNPHDKFEKFSRESSENKCMLNKCLSCNFSVIVKTLKSTEEESESETSIATTGSSNYFSLVINVALQSAVGKLQEESLNQKLIFHPTTQYICLKKI